MFIEYVQKHLIQKFTMTVAGEVKKKEKTVFFYFQLKVQWKYLKQSETPISSTCVEGISAEIGLQFSYS